MYNMVDRHLAQSLQIHRESDRVREKLTHTHTHRLKDKEADRQKERRDTHTHRRSYTDKERCSDGKIHWSAERWASLERGALILI